MAATKVQDNKKETGLNNLFNDYYWFYSNIYNNVQKAAGEFFKKEFDLRFMGISFENNVLFYGDEYFVNKIPVNKMTSVVLRISSNLVSSFLDLALGTGENPFELEKITDIEERLIKSFTAFVYKNIETFLNKAEMNKKAIQNSLDYNFTFFVKQGKNHAGKIILTVPKCILPEIKSIDRSERFRIDDFKTTKVYTRISAGSAKIALNDIKTIENGDIIVLDNSDINKMAVVLNDNEISFKITPNPSLIISIDSTGDNEMEEQTEAKPQNMWDSILVDIVAEFDNVKLTLGELKQISEGLVIDLGSIYDNKIKLRVENQIVASGELVILNDRYGVRIENVKKSKEEPSAAPKPAQPIPAKPTAVEQKKPAAAKPSAPLPAKSAGTKKPVKPAAAPPANPAQNKVQGNENFDYSDFEIEDESI